MKLSPPLTRQHRGFIRETEWGGFGGKESDTENGGGRGDTPETGKKI